MTRHILTREKKRGRDWSNECSLESKNIGTPRSCKGQGTDYPTKAPGGSMAPPDLGLLASRTVK